MSKTEEDPSEIGQQYFYGKGRRKNYKKAFPYLLTAANMGDPHCQNLVGYCFDIGLGVEKDKSLAFYWYKYAAENDDIEGIYNLALFYSKDKADKLNNKKAFSLYKKAAERGDAPSQCNLAIAYLDGEGTKRNEEEGLKWMKKAAKHGDSKAQFNLGEMYLIGVDLTRNVKNAKSWLLKAASQGHRKAEKLLKTINTNS